MTRKPTALGVKVAAQARACSLVLVLLVSVVSLAWLFAAPAHAGFAARILVVSERGIASSTRSDVADALSLAGEVVSDEGYRAAADEAGLDPLSDEALSSVAPAQYVTMVVTVSRAGPGVAIAYHDGHNGALVGETNVDVRRGQIATQGQEAITRDAQAALAQIEGRGLTSKFGGRATGTSPFARAQAPLEPQPQEEQGSIAPEMTESEAPVADDAELEAAPDAEAAPSRFEVRLGAGLGFALRNVSVPSARGLRVMETGLHPAADLLFHVEDGLSAHVRLALHMHYQTSLFAMASEAPPAGVLKETTLRSHYVQLGFVPSFRFSDSPSSVSIGVFAGWAILGMRTVVALGIPSYTLHGPVVRLELRLPFAAGAVALRVAPELLAIGSVSGELRRVGGLGGRGVGFGGEASFDIRVSDSAAISLSYRESHLASLSLWGGDFTDVQRYATVSGVLQY